MNVSRLVAFTAVLGFCVGVLAPTVDLPAQARGPEPESGLPVVKAAEMPLYPELARSARIEGTAQMQVWTNGTSIVKVEGSGAHKLLIDAAEKNLRTWRLYPHKPISFTATFVYSLEQVEVPGFVNPSIVLHLPTRVEIRTKQRPVEYMEMH